jgi:hypothetical protein
MEYHTGMPDEDLPFSPELPKRKLRREKGVFRTAWDSCFDLISLPRLGDRLWKDLGGMLRRHRVFIVVLVLAVAALVHFFDPFRTSAPSAPYTGETKMKLFFPGDGSEPQTVSKANIYRVTAMGVEMDFTAPKSDKEINIAKARAWIVQLIFEKEINAENMQIVYGGGLGPNMRLERKDFTNRSAVVVIVPIPAFNDTNPTEPINPKGMLELQAVRRVVTTPDNLTPPSATPHKATSPH